jgi:hypothetical protein
VSENRDRLYVSRSDMMPLSRDTYAGRQADESPNDQNDRGAFDTYLVCMPELTVACDI